MQYCSEDYVSTLYVVIIFLSHDMAKKSCLFQSYFNSTRCSQVSHIYLLPKHQEKVKCAMTSQFQDTNLINSAIVCKWLHVSKS